MIKSTIQTLGNTFHRSSMRIAVIGLFVTGVIQAQSVFAENPKTTFPYEGSFHSELTVGETWVFEHHGVQSSGNIGQPVEGDRIQEVVAAIQQNDKNLWVMKETWGSNDVDSRRYFLDAQRFLSTVENGAEVFRLTPPVQFCLYDMKPGEVKEYSTVEKSDTQSFAITLKATRLLDETLTLPAGEYQDCQKVNLVITFKHPEFDEPLNLNYMIWYHPKANGMVKESFKCALPNQNGQYIPPLTAVSLLKSYSINPKER